MCHLLNKYFLIGSSSMNLLFTVVDLPGPNMTKLPPNVAKAVGDHHAGRRVFGNKLAYSG